MLKFGNFPNLKTGGLCFMVKIFKKWGKGGGLNISLSCWRDLEVPCQKNTLKNLRCIYCL